MSEHGRHYKRLDEESFPTVYEDDRIHVYHNRSGEIFVKQKISGVGMRISPHGDQIDVTANGGYLDPWGSHSMVKRSFAICPRR
jgi:hypothetical protein